MLFLAEFNVIKPDWGIIFWTSVIFILFWYIMSKYAFGPIASALQKREESIAEALNEAKKAREEMQNLNENIVGMVYLQQGNALLQQLTDSSNLIGKEITFLDPQTQAEKKGVVDKVKIVDGQALLDVDGQDVPLAYVTEVTAGTTQDDGQV